MLNTMHMKFGMGMPACYDGNRYYGDDRWEVRNLGGTINGVVEVLSNRFIFDTDVHAREILKKAREYLPKRYDFGYAIEGEFYNLGNILVVSALNSAFLDLGIKKVGVAHPEHVWASLREETGFDTRWINGDFGIVIYGVYRHNSKYAEHLMAQIEERFGVYDFPVFAARLRAARDKSFEYGVRLDLAENSVVYEAPSLEESFSTTKYQSFHNMLKNGYKVKGNVMIDAGHKGLTTMHLSCDHARKDKHGVRYQEPLITTQTTELDWFFWPARIFLSGNARY